MDLDQIKQWLIKNKLILGVVAVILLLVCVIITQRQPANQGDKEALPISQFATLGDKKSKSATLPLEQTTQQESKPKQEKTDEVKVDIKGAVKFSGVYPAKNNQVVDELIKLAVPLKNADLDAVNLAQTVQDGMVIYIPYKGEVKENKYAMYQQAIQRSQSPLKTNQKVININTAEQSALEEIPGIGEKKAQDIIHYRETNGGFKSIEEIKEIKGIGDKTFEHLKDYISV
ncbi:helix-hairpin-helix domain-containing protein [Macrococcus capreoli]|uniref:helix-hairpin-helix domain-containing protein n=1 Tax=Macrococcus capreoli TaxID=2982690 RepID=UPI003F432B3C